MAALSRRALANIQPDPEKDLGRAAFYNQYDPEKNPGGVVAMAVAENRLIGSKHLKSALARYLNNILEPQQSIESGTVVVLSGVSNVVNTVAFCICNEGEGILIGRPLYVGFISDLAAVSRVVPVKVELKGVDPTGVDAVSRYEEALEVSEAQGIKIRAIMLSSPHNPLGRPYAPAALEAYLRLCSRRNIHLLSDEVYAKAVFPNADVPRPEPFKSVLSFNLPDYIDPSLVHVFYGMSKDFCANGLRIGCLVSQNNRQLLAAVRAISKFAWPCSLADRAWANLLEDDRFLADYFPLLIERLARAYKFCTTYLKELEIPYIPACAGPFLWVDMSGLLMQQTAHGELDLAWKLVNGGVWLATGQAYSSEKVGNFRLTFAVPEDEMKLGMDR
ncbi:MAG: hypothetical protein Q9227_006850 [Pyrenula ochraceoflavens]